MEALEWGAWFPSVLESPEPAGRVGAGHGPLQGTSVAAGAGDQAAAAVGVGAVRLRGALGRLGRPASCSRRFPPMPTTSEARVHAFCHAVPGTWQAMGVMLSAAGSLQWGSRRAAPGSPFDGLVEEAEAWPAGAEGLVFLPGADAAR